MTDFLETPLFGITLTLAAYLFGLWIVQKTKISVLPPVLTATALVIAVLLIFKIDYAVYGSGAAFVQVLLVPATVCLAIPIYHKRELLKKNWLPLVVGCAVGGAVCVGSVWLLCRAFGLDDTLTLSLLPKSITTPFGIAISEGIGGIPSITVMCIIITGIFGAVAAPLLIRLFRVKDPAAIGIAIGTSSHVLGTTKALQLGEEEGAMSGLAISITGIVTVLYLLFL